LLVEVGEFGWEGLDEAIVLVGVVAADPRLEIG